MALEQDTYIWLFEGLAFERKKIKLVSHAVHFLKAGVGPNLLFLHGGNFGLGQWYKNIEYFSKFNLVYALDLPFAGESTRPFLGRMDLFEDFVKVVEEFIYRLEIKHVTIVAHSFSGWIALKLANLIPNKINKLILVNPIGFTASVPLTVCPLTLNSFVRIASKTMLKPSKENIRKILEKALWKTEILEEKFVDYVFECINKKGALHPLLFMNQLTSKFRFRPELFSRDLLTSIFQPCLIIHGAKDRMLCQNKQIQGYRLLKNVEVSVLPNCGHVPFLENPSEFNSIVTSFIEQI